MIDFIEVIIGTDQTRSRQALTEMIISGVTTV